MRYAQPALLLIAVASLVACGGRPAVPAVARVARPVPAATAVPPAIERARAVALLRSRLELPSARRRLRLPGDSAINLTPSGPGRFAFATRCHAYVPASSLPWVYEVAGTVDLPSRVVSLARLAAVPPAPRDPIAARASDLFPPFEVGPALAPIHVPPSPTAGQG